ncbi:alpha/beta fold hydrolase [Actinokineospora sp. NBRC 105648]|uniref:thioesterase II family protein n=1 Tax=Actinokineospora sp. NBRC 105648 TaxID=3032206 RepID=UPI0024A1DB20|nr:alpha/beta fold hydrolase [Actinokineospora sp. NBRC 105648]GLZ42505.1 non-ribosomal peptide synthase [Actinokineospora sp. NBRC 105648]
MGSWFEPAEVGADAPLRLFLFPHAGSGGAIYRNWDGLLTPDFAQQIVSLPGREKRFGEDAFMEIEPLVDALYDALLDELDDRPYAFFGHCLGAQLAYRVAVCLRRDGERGPILIGASGWSPEGFQQATYEQSQMPEPDLIEWMKTLGSFPEEVYGDPQVMQMIIPALRADLAVVSTYVDDAAEVDIPLVSYSGKQDPLMSPGAMVAWQTRTTEYLGNSEFTGDHFYIDNPDHAVAVTADLTRHLVRRLAPA